MQKNQYRQRCNILNIYTVIMNEYSSNDDKEMNYYFNKIIPNIKVFY